MLEVRTLGVDREMEDDDDLWYSSRSRVMEFLIQSAHELKVSPMVKYSALSFFADRFYPKLHRMGENKGGRHWLLAPLTESKLQLFGVISFWISSKIHDSPPISVKKIKKLTDEFIKEQHFTSRDLLDAVLEFRIGTSRIAFVFLDDLLDQFKAVACIGEYLSYETCMDVMDLLYEKEETSLFYGYPQTLAASVAAYVISAPLQKYEFPVVSWVKFVTSCKEDGIVKLVRKILKHVFG